LSRAFVIVLDSLGVGALPDAADFGDEGTHTLDHLVGANGGLNAPRLVELGLGCIEGVKSLEVPDSPAGAFVAVLSTLQVRTHPLVIGR
jgi:phosphopentomutase